MILGIWVAGLLLLGVVWGTTTLLLRHTRAGRAQHLSPRELLTVLAVVIGMSCALLTVLTLLA